MAAQSTHATHYRPSRNIKVRAFLMAACLQLGLMLWLLQTGLITSAEDEAGQTLTIWDVSRPIPKIIFEKWPDPADNAGGSSEKTDPRLPKMTVAQAAPDQEPKLSEQVDVTPKIKPLTDAILPVPDKSTLDASSFDSKGTAILGKQNPGSGSGLAGMGIGKGIGDGIGNGMGPGFELEPARWVRELTYYQLRRFYPKNALEQKISGEVDLICTITLKRRVRTCHVEAETPRGAGFGKASLEASKRFRIYPREIDGEPIDGAPVQIKIWYDPDPLAPDAKRQ